MTLNGVVVSRLRNFTEFGTHCVKVVEYTPILSATEM